MQTHKGLAQLYYAFLPFMNSLSLSTYHLTYHSRPLTSAGMLESSRGGGGELPPPRFLAGGKILPALLLLPPPPPPPRFLESVASLRLD